MTVPCTYSISLSNIESKMVDTRTIMDWFAANDEFKSIVMCHRRVSSSLTHNLLIKGFLVAVAFINSTHYLFDNALALF